MSDNDLIRRGDAIALTCDPFGAETVTSQAINAIHAAQPTVKPLVWFETADGGETCLTDERYSISYWEREKLFVDRYTTMRRHPTIEAAKAAAQADYEARILSALDMQPTVSPDVAVAAIVVADAIDADMQSFNALAQGFKAQPDMLGRHFFSKALRHYAAALARVKGVM